MRFNVGSQPRPHGRVWSSSDQAAVIVLDGSWDWGEGEAGGKACVEELPDSLEFPLSTEQFAAVLASAVARSIEESGIDVLEWGSMYCGIALLVTSSDLVVLQAGSLCAAVVRHGRLIGRTTAERWVDQQVASGHLSPQAAEEHPLRSVLVGPHLGHSREPDLVRHHFQLEDGDTVLVANDEAFRESPSCSVADVDVSFRAKVWRAS